eukprot:273395-Alexandrium_andersonii.AAC.1
MPCCATSRFVSWTRTARLRSRVRIRAAFAAAASAARGLASHHALHDAVCGSSWKTALQPALP